MANEQMSTNYFLEKKLIKKYLNLKLVSFKNNI